MRASNRLKPMNNNEPKSKSFEASLESLEQIVRELEDGDLPLEKSLELFEQGIRLSRECQERLGQAERRIEMLMRDSQGRTVVSSFVTENELNSNGPNNAGNE
jgi:exodeoxyribonuclease VII small subunit